MSSKGFLVVNGPNLNLLGEREPSIYGSISLSEIEEACRSWGKRQGREIRCFQSNAEGALLDFLHENRRNAAGAVLNGAAYTHTSIALRDCVRAIGIPVIEVHLSNVAAREPFRATSLLAPVARGTISGLGPRGYLLALDALLALESEGKDVFGRLPAMGAENGALS